MDNQINLEEIQNRVNGFIDGTNDFNHDFDSYLKSTVGKQNHEISFEYSLGKHLNINQDDFNRFISRIYVNFSNNFYKMYNGYEKADEEMLKIIQQKYNIIQEKENYIKLLSKRYGKNQCYIISECYKMNLLKKDSYNSHIPYCFREDVDLKEQIEKNKDLFILFLLNDCFNNNNNKTNLLKSLKIKLAKKGIYGKSYLDFIKINQSYFINNINNFDSVIKYYKNKSKIDFLEDEDIKHWLKIKTLFDHSNKQKLLFSLIKNQEDLNIFKSFKKNYNNNKDAYYAIDDYMFNSIESRELKTGNIFDLLQNVLNWQKGNSINKIKKRNGIVYLSLW